MVRTLGRGPARRWLEKQARLMGLKIVKRNGTTWWFIKDGPCSVACLRFGNYTLRRL